ncbi:MAG: response regulator [Proteobacteria bacterium]|nr:response regulator [Pseudomonadota bacterium]
MGQYPDEICVNKHVLVVDDEEQNQYLLEVILKGEKCVVTCAGNGLEALEYLRKDTFHLIISDILMPKMDGFHFCRECKSDSGLKDIPFVFYTASYTDKKDEEFAQSLGADRFIQKPIEPVSFMSIVKEVLYEYEKGIIPSKIPIFKEEVPYLREYNERIIQKLEQKVTELDAAYKLLAENEQKYRSIFVNAVEGIFQSTPEGKLITVNPSLARMFGFASPEEMVSDIDDIGKRLYVNPEDRIRYKKALGEQGIIQSLERQHYRKDGSKFWVSVNARAVRDSTGKILHYEGTVEDITGRKAADEILKETADKLQKSLLGTIKAISMIVETRDPYTAGHQRRVASLAREIAKEMGLSKNAIENIFIAGVIHDIGKISVPAEILSKPGILTHIEMELIKIHSRSGYDILKDVELPYPIAEIVLQHHERLDGSGYPQCLKNSQIFLESRIICIADVVEAISSHRPYRPARGIDNALEEIKKNAGILYDMEAVNVCLKLFREKGFKFE